SDTTLTQTLAVEDTLPPWYQPYFRLSGTPQTRLPLTEEVQADIWRSQNPPACAGHALVVHRRSNFGLSAQLHWAAGSLGMAMEHGHIFTWHAASGTKAFMGRYCDEAGVHNPSCFFVPPSNCSDQAAAAGAAVVPYAVHNYTIPSKFESEMPPGSPWRKVMTLNYWWRAQVATYLFRFNKRTSRELIQRRQRSAARGAPPLPLPPNTFSIHVRHGDKWKEMNLQSWDAHLHAADVAARARGVPASQRFVYLTTDDPRVVESALATHGWTVYVLPCPLQADGSPLPCRTTDNTTNPAFGISDSEQGHADADEIMLFALEGLMIALEATHFVGQRGSSWTVLIDDLRHTLVGSAFSFDTPYIDVDCSLHEWYWPEDYACDDL
ncbi:hypothetical protein JKP88DRAFT_307816, partial [Tribonema minus]